jgi:hypothetical protein
MLGGVHGIIWGIAMTHVLYYVALVTIIKHTGTWMPRIDLAFITGCGALIIGCKFAMGHF